MEELFCMELDHGARKVGDCYCMLPIVEYPDSVPSFMNEIQMWSITEFSLSWFSQSPRLSGCLFHWAVC